jgi:hypothetical protein
MTSGRGCADGDLASRGFSGARQCSCEVSHIIISMCGVVIRKQATDPKVRVPIVDVNRSHVDPEAAIGRKDRHYRCFDSERSMYQMLRHPNFRDPRKSRGAYRIQNREARTIDLAIHELDRVIDIALTMRMRLASRRFEPAEVVGGDSTPINFTLSAEVQIIRAEYRATASPTHASGGIRTVLSWKAQLFVAGRISWTSSAMRAPGGLKRGSVGWLDTSDKRLGGGRLEKGSTRAIVSAAPGSG